MGWNVVGTEPDVRPPASKWTVVGSEPEAKDGDAVSASGHIPEGFYAVTGDDGRKTLRHNLGAGDITRMLGDLPGVGMAERVGQGAARLAGKAASGIAGLFGGADTVHRVQDTVNSATELPPSNDPLVQAAGAYGHIAENTPVIGGHDVDQFVGNLPPGLRTGVEGVEEAIPDVAGVLGLKAPAAAAGRAATAPIAKTSAEVAKEAGYTGLSSKADLASPGATAITDKLIGSDAGILPEQSPSVANLENARKVGPGKVYDETRQALPEQLTQDGQLKGALSNLPQQVSQLPRSPDVQALQDVMLNQPNMSRDELFANISEARERAKSNWKSDDPDKNALGDAYSRVADAYEDFIDRQPGVDLPKWQQARVQMAKNYLAQGALRGEHFNAQSYGRVMEQSPHLLTGNAQIVGHVANGLPAGSAPGVASAMAPAAGGALAGEVVGSHFGFPGVGTVAGAVAAPLARAFLERMFTRGNPALAGGTSTNPALSYFFDHPGAAPPPGEAPSPWALGEGANPNAPQPQGRQGDVPLADVLSHGVEEGPSAGVSAGPMGAPPQDGLTFTGSPDAVGARPRQGGSPRVAEATDDYGNRVALSKSNDPGAVWEAEQPRGRMEVGDRRAAPSQQPEGDVPLADRFAPPQAPQEPGVQYQGRLENPPLVGREGGPAFARNFAPEDRAPQVDPGVPSGDVQRAETSRAGEAAQGGRPGLEDANVSRYGIRGSPEFPYEGPRPTGKPRWTGKGPEPEEPEPFDPSTPPKRPSGGGGAGQMNREAILGDLMESWFNDRRNISDETPTVRTNNGSSPGASGAGSLESINRGSKNLIETNGDNANPVARGVDQVDLAPKKGHVFVNADTGKLVDSGGMSPRQAQAVLNRFKARKTLADELEPSP